MEQHEEQLKALRKALLKSPLPEDMIGTVLSFLPDNILKHMLSYKHKDDNTSSLIVATAVRNERYRRYQQHVQTLPKRQIFDLQNQIFLRGDGQLFNWWESSFLERELFLDRRIKINTGRPELLDLLQNKNITQVASRGHTILLLTDEGNVYGLGSNRKGQLGLGFISPPRSYFSTPQLITALSNEYIIQIVNAHNNCLF